MADQAEGRAGRGALQPGDQVGPLRYLGEDLGLPAGVVEHPAQEVEGRAFVTGWVDRVELDQALKKLDRVHGPSIPPSPAWQKPCRSGTAEPDPTGPRFKRDLPGFGQLAGREVETGG